MSYTSLAACTRDLAIRDRTQSAVVQEALTGSGQGTPFGEAIAANPEGRWVELVWPVALNCEADYESAFITDPATAAGNVSDGQILAAVQAHWPAEVVA